MFHEPFTSDSRLRHVLRRLVAAKWVTASPYAVASRGGSPVYYKLTRAGYRIAFGDEVPTPKRRYFEPIGIALHQHTRALADVLVHLIVSAHDSGIRIEQYQRENSLRLDSGSDHIFPDASFALRTPGRQPVRFMLELDNGTERIRSTRDVESIERKIRVYDLCQSSLEAFDPERFVVLFVTTRGKERVQHILETAASVVSNRHRKLICAIDSRTVLQQDDPIFDPCFLDHNFQRQPLLQTATDAEKMPQQLLAPALAMC